MLRQKRQPEKPTLASRIWLVVNSGIFLWFISAVVLASAGSYFSNYQECVRDAEQLITQHDRISREISNRQLFVWSLVLSAKDMNEIHEGLKACPVTYAEFKELSTFELKQLFKRLEAQIDASTELKFNLYRSSDKHFESSTYHQLADCNFPGEKSYIYSDPAFDAMMHYTMPSLTGPSDLTEIRRFALYMQRRMSSNWYNNRELSPSCKFKNLLDRFQHGRAAHIAAYSNLLPGPRIR